MSRAADAPDCPFCERPFLTATLLALLVGALALQAALLWFRFA